jgi:hypothetical protein
VQVLRHVRRRQQVFLLVVEAAAMHRPQFAEHAGRAIRLQRAVEHDEVEGLADPRDRGDHVQPAQQEGRRLDPEIHAQLPR